MARLMLTRHRESYAGLSYPEGETDEYTCRFYRAWRSDAGIAAGYREAGGVRQDLGRGSGKLPVRSGCARPAPFLIIPDSGNSALSARALDMQLQRHAAQCASGWEAQKGQ